MFKTLRSVVLILGYFFFQRSCRQCCGFHILLRTSVLFLMLWGGGGKTMACKKITKKTTDKAVNKA